MEDGHREEYQNDDVGLQIPPLDPNFPLFSENDEITLATNNDGVDFPFNVDFDFSFDDLSFADDLLLEQPEPSSEPEAVPLVLGSDNSSVRVDDCSIYDAISSEESNSPDIGSSKSNSGGFGGKSCDRDRDVSSILLIDCNDDNNSDDRLELSRKSIKVENDKVRKDNRNNSSSSGSGSGTGNGSGSGGSVSDCVSKSKLKRKIEVEERDENVENRIRKFRRSNTVEISNDENDDGGGEGGGDDDDKKKARLIRNRESAQLSRQRMMRKYESRQRTITKRGYLLRNLFRNRTNGIFAQARPIT